MWLKISHSTRTPQITKGELQEQKGMEERKMEKVIGRKEEQDLKEERKLEAEHK